MRLIKTMTVGAAAAAALVMASPVAQAGSSAVAGERTFGPAASTRLGPFATLAECNKSRREWDITHTVNDCWDETIDGRRGWYFNAW